MQILYALFFNCFKRKGSWGKVMRNVTITMINEYGLKRCKCDFMGYRLQKDDTYSFHHLVLSHKKCNELDMERNGYFKWNGAVLCASTAHPYLHTIERYDSELFYLMTCEMLDMNIKGHLDIWNLVRIHEMLEDFESRFRGEKTKRGHLIVPEKYEKRLVLKPGSEDFERIRKFSIDRRRGNGIM